MPSTFILAVDVGAGSLRAGLVRTSGRVEAAAAIPLAIAVPRRGWAELDPERWWQALRTASARVLRALPRSGRVLAVCICGLTRTQVLLDQRGRTVGRAIAFRDARAAAIARELDGTSAFGRRSQARVGSSVISPRGFRAFMPSPTPRTFSTIACAACWPATA